MPLMKDITSIKRDFLNLFRPYKSINNILKDLLLQPLYGVGNTLFGMVFTLYGGFLLIAALPALIISMFIDNKYKVGTKYLAFIHIFARGIVALFRGVTQIVTTPLTWIFKIPIRLRITACHGFTKIEENIGIQRLVAKFDQLPASEDLLSKQNAIVRKIHSKFETAYLDHCQKTNIFEGRQPALKYRESINSYDELYFEPPLVTVCARRRNHHYSEKKSQTELYAAKPDTSENLKEYINLFRPVM
jgi:hypothetical protein